MTTASANPKRPESKDPEVPLAQRVAFETQGAGGVIAWSSFFFALLQSLCTFFAAVDGVRLLIGAGALVVSTGVGATMDWVHADWLRLPMIALALAGSLLNLVVLWQIRRLRSRPAAQWRQKPVSKRKIRMERVQFVLSIVTLVLIGVEEYWHLRWHHHV
jgi:hypothetical protein